MSLEPINSALFLHRQTSPKVWVITSNHDIVTEISQVISPTTFSYGKWKTFHYRCVVYGEYQRKQKEATFYRFSK